jgi:hypothetical protein
MRSADNCHDNRYLHSTVFRHLAQLVDQVWQRRIVLACQAIHFQVVLRVLHMRPELAVSEKEHEFAQGCVQMERHRKGWRIAWNGDGRGNHGECELSKVFFQYQYKHAPFKRLLYCRDRRYLTCLYPAQPVLLRDCISLITSGKQTMDGMTFIVLPVSSSPRIGFVRGRKSASLFIIGVQHPIALPQ